MVSAIEIRAGGLAETITFRVVNPQTEDHYFVDTKAQAGSHVVHTPRCSGMTSARDFVYLGLFPECETALEAAKDNFPAVNGCELCSFACHTRVPPVA